MKNNATKTSADAAQASLIQYDAERRKDLLDEARRRDAARAYCAKAEKQQRIDRFIRRLLVRSITFFTAVCLLDQLIR